MGTVMTMNGMLYLFYGSDRNPIKTRTEALLAETGIAPFDAETFDMEETTVDGAVIAAMTIPFLSERKAVILRNAYFFTAAPKPAKEPEHHLERLTEYLDHPNPTTVFIVQVNAEKLDTRKALYRAFAERATISECAPTRKEDVYGSVRTELAAAGLAIDADALEEFIIRTRDDPGTTRNELDKLMLFAQGKKSIDAAMVRAVTTKNLEDNVFDLVNAYLAKDAWSVTTVFQDIMRAGVDPAGIVGLVAGKFQEILYTKELLRTGSRFDDVMKYFSASKGRTYYIMKNANEQGDAYVIDRLAKLATLDFQMKSGTIDKRVGLETFLYQFD